MKEYPKPTIQQSIDSWHIVLDLIELGYPHNFQREAPWVAQYCRDISKIIDKAFEVKDEKNRSNAERPKDIVSDEKQKDNGKKDR